MLVVFCALNVFESKPQALFVADDAFIVSVIGSVLLSVALSVGIALATGGESVYTAAANALWDYFLTGEAQDDVNEAINKLRLYGSFVYQGGKLYFALNQNGYNFFRSWISGIDWANFHAMANLVYTGNDFPTFADYWGYESVKDYYAVSEQPHMMTARSFGATATYNPNSGLYILLENDQTQVHYSTSMGSTSNPYLIIDSGKYGGLSIANNNGCFLLSAVCWNHNGSIQAVNNLNNAESFNYGRGLGGGAFDIVPGNNNYNKVAIKGVNHKLFWQNNNIYLDDTNHVLAHNISEADYSKKCIVAGCLLIDSSVVIDGTTYVPNTNNGMSEYNMKIDTEVVAPAIPNNTGIGRNQYALIPVPGNTVDLQDETIVLSPGEVKQYDKEGKDYTFVPVPGQLQGKTGADLGVTVMNKTTFEENTSSVYVPDYPDVFPTASPDVTITAGADVFPSVAPTEAPTAGEGSTADAIAGDIADIKDEIGDLSTPLTPPQAQDGTNKMKLPTLLLQKFPFCIPYDLYNGINQFNAEAEMPSFDIPFHFAQINFDYTMHIDFEKFTTLAKICQWFFSVSWVVILILLTRKVIWK